MTVSDFFLVADYIESGDSIVAEITENTDKIEITDEPQITQNKEAVSINPLDVAGSASSDEDSIPIWMRPKAKTNNRRNRPRNNGGNAEPRARHNRYTTGFNNLLLKINWIKLVYSSSKSFVILKICDPS